MRRQLAALFVVTLGALEAHAQISSLVTTPSRRSGTGQGFAIGPRIASYSTEADIDITTLETGRQTGFGVVGEFRSGSFVLDFNFDHDPENGLQFIDLLGTESYSRDRVEGAIGWAAIPFLDLQAGLRMDTIQLGGFTGAFFGDDYEYQALAAGVKLHTPQNRPFGLYGVARGYTGTLDFGNSGAATQTDMSGWRLEGGVVIPIGESNWSAVPGIEYEYLDSENGELTLDTNRFFVSFVYTFPR